ncbi:MAG: DNA repair protein RadC [Bacteroidaceae bacterium]|nr:DNA repair protein RadC [Bacteroidaceae bacterium]
MMDKLTINRWAEEDRPREKMISKGAQALTNAELLAILIGSGNDEDSAVGLMQKVLAAYDNSIDRLGRLSVDELCRFKGIGPAKAVTILAACELGRRRAVEQPERRQIRSAAQVYDYYYPLLRDLPVEECHVMLLNQSARVIDSVRIGMGGLTETVVDVRLILREALIKRATSLILCHNHPSGNLRPSTHDDKLTRQVQEAARLLNISLIDHIIFTDEGYYSYADEGKL